MSARDDRPGEKPRRAETLDAAVSPPGGATSDGRAIAVPGDYLPRIRVGRLETIAHWRRLVGKIMRAMLKGEMPPEHGTKLIWAARVGADLAKAEQEQRTLDELNGRLARLESGDSRGLAGGADDLTDEELQEIARRGRPALEAPSESSAENEL